jgi:hypothetical protein
VAAFSEYAKAADLANGVVWYAALGVGAALTEILASVAGIAGQSSATVTAASWLVIVLSVVICRGLAMARIVKADAPEVGQGPRSVSNAAGRRYTSMAFLGE